jgi:hypothetical protein
MVAAAVSAGVALAQSDGPAAPQSKVIAGTNRADHLVGTRHADQIDGRGGNDSLTGRGGRDSLSGGSGNDTIHARDRHQDAIDCGPGNDTAVVDRAENGVYDCEHIRYPTPSQKQKESR